MAIKGSQLKQIKNQSKGNVFCYICYHRHTLSPDIMNKKKKTKAKSVQYYATAMKYLPVVRARFTNYV